ncbi:hypothetical protein GCM10009530_22170 [Microbispora corallina]|uniref:Uncharacterized protein n=1 Tax=Microbispora corallina TaxID=83302 RepID=A0ABQ4G659_9ACTN|nr:hypothetical protein [Microbispora corallina]GIH42559.1 hypothetical protein Mco01_55590 [Microbispora corallina]
MSENVVMGQRQGGGQSQGRRRFTPLLGGDFSAAPPRWSVNLVVVIAALAVAAVVVGAAGWVLISAGAIGGGAQPAATAEATRLAGAEPVATATWNNLPVRDGSLELWVDKVESARRVVPELFGKLAYNLGRTAQGQFVIDHITMTNLGGVRGQLMDENQALFDAQDQRYSAVPEAGAYFDTAMFYDLIAWRAGFVGCWRSRCRAA